MAVCHGSVRERLVQLFAGTRRLRPAICCFSLHVETSIAIGPYVRREYADRCAASSVHCRLDLGDRRRRRRLIVARPARALATDQRMVCSSFRSQRMPGDGVAFQTLSCRIVGARTSDRSCDVLRGGSHSAVTGTPILLIQRLFACQTVAAVAIAVGRGRETARACLAACRILRRERIRRRRSVVWARAVRHA